jgi:predicted transposase/invertase (TIGR01784 family)
VKRLDPKLDVVFKLMLTREPALLIDMLEGVLAKPVGVPAILDSSFPGERVGDKGISFDIRAALGDGSRVDLEMQGRWVPALAPRLIYYGARDYAAQLRRGDGYQLLTPTAVIVWLAESLFPALDRLHSAFELRERHTHAPFGDFGGHLTIHLLQLPHLSRAGTIGYDAKVERWARFFTASDGAALDQLASEDPIMSLAKQTLDRLSQDPEAQRLAQEREDELKLHRIGLLTMQAEAKAKGKAEGKAEGRADILLKLLGLRFGLPAEATRARVEKATLEQLDAWAERVLTAQTLYEVFEP